MNKHGLERYIPANTKRLVRRRCGFGCVFCGRAIVQYHHFDPPFEDAIGHNSERITLLCGHCHDRVERGLLAGTAVIAANANPYCRRTGYVKDDLLFEQPRPYVRFAGTDIFCQYPVVYGSEIIVGFDPPEEPGAPSRLQALLYGPSGNRVFEVTDNEWRTRTAMYDVVTKGNRLEIREAPGKVALAAQISSDQGLEIHTLDMSFKGCSVLVRDGVMTIRGRSGGVIQTTGGSVRGEAGVYFDANGDACLGAAGIPFLAQHIAEFRPMGDLELAMTRYRDGAEARERFLTMLFSSDVFVLRRGPIGTDGNFVALSFQVDAGSSHLAVLTTPARREPVTRWAKDPGEIEVMPFRNVLGFSSMTHVWLNPWNPIALRLPRELLTRWIQRKEGKLDSQS